LACTSATRAGVKRRDTRTTGAHPLGQRALGVELDRELTIEVLAGKQFVLPDV
jgi:hypothetical protein